VCGLNLGSFQIQTFPFFFSPYTFFSTLISRARARLLFPVQPSRPNQQRIPAHQPFIKPTTPFLSPTDRARVSVIHSSLSLLPSPRIRTAPGKPRRGRACAGRDTLPIRPAHTPRDRSAHTRESNPAWTGNTSFTPRLTPLHLSLREGERRCLGRPGGQSRGSLGFSPRRFRCQGSKAREEAETQTSKLPTPLGFSLSSSPETAP
jgi:hypothetical protein